MTKAIRNQRLLVLVFVALSAQPRPAFSGGAIPATRQAARGSCPLQAPCGGNACPTDNAGTCGGGAGGLCCCPPTETFAAQLVLEVDDQPTTPDPIVACDAMNSTTVAVRLLGDIDLDGVADFDRQIVLVPGGDPDPCNSECFPGSPGPANEGFFCRDSTPARFTETLMLQSQTVADWLQWHIFPDDLASAIRAQFPTSEGVPVAVSVDPIGDTIDNTANDQPTSGRYCMTIQLVPAPDSNPCPTTGPPPPPAVSRHAICNVVPPPPSTATPLLSRWGVALTVMLLFGIGCFSQWRRRRWSH